MTTNFERHYYLFKGDWYDIFIQLLDLIPSDNQHKFDIWEPQDKSKNHNVIIIYGSPLSTEYCHKNKIWSTHEKIFEAFYFPKMHEYNIHLNYYAKENEPNEVSHVPYAMNYHLPSSL